MAGTLPKPGRRWWLVWVRRLAGTLLLLTALVGGGWIWYHHRPQPAPLRRQLFPGVEYIRQSRRSPRPMVIHTATVALDTPGIDFVVTPGDPEADLPLRARTTSQFAREFGVQLAINGDFFLPWHSDCLWDYYPHVGDPVKVRGPAAYQGVAYSRGSANWKSGTLHLARNGEARIAATADLARVWGAVSGFPLLLCNGAPVKLTATEPEPRSAVGLDRERKRLFLVVVDGRQPNYSEGMTHGELAVLLRDLGAYTAINLDGGGSSTLVAETRPGHWKALNSPIDNRMPGCERPVANHLGVRLPRGH